VTRRVDVLWYCTRLASSEHCSMALGDDGTQFDGTAVLPIGEEPGHIEWAAHTDAGGRTQSAHADITTAAGTRRLELAAGAERRWRVDGAPVGALDGCDDVDFGWTPATNTLPIRRLGLAPGASATIRAAWVRFPELDVVLSEQMYTRLADDRWRYASGSFEAELTVDPATGVVQRYGTDLWQAAAYRVTSAGRPSAAQRNS
jgi:hypothetical protein